MQKNNALTGLKGLAAICVLICHCFRDYPENSQVMQKFLHGFGSLGVLIFLIISGVLTGYQNKQGDASLKGAFGNLLGKIRRIYPIYLASQIITLAVISRTYIPVQLEKGLTQFGARLALYALMLQSYLPHNTIAYGLNGASWYLSSCTLFWFLTPFILKQINHLKTRKSFYLAGSAFCMITLIYLAVIRMLFTSLDAYFTYIFPGYILLFFIQAAIWGVFLNRYGMPKQLSEKMWLGGAAAAALAVLYGIKLILPECFGMPLMTPAVLILVISVLIYRKDSAACVLTSKPLLFLGEISVELFLFQFAVIYAMDWIWTMDPTPFTRILTMAVCILAAWGIHQLIHAVKKHSISAAKS